MRKERNEEMGKECDVNDLIRVEFGGMNLAQLVFCQAVVLPEIAEVIDKYVDAIIGLGD